MDFYYLNSRFTRKRILAVSFYLFLAVSAGFLSCIPCGTCKKGSREEVVDKWNIYRQNKSLGIGINLGNALDAPNEGEWGVVLKESYFSHVKSLGFRSVRIPVRWSAHIDTNPPYVIDPAFMSRVLWAIDQALINNLRVIVNVHHFEQLMSEPARYSRHFISIWRQIADRCASYGPELYFELCNEPNGALSSELWNELAAEAISVIRKSNPKRSVIVGGAEWNSADGLRALKLPSDSFIIATFHCYEPSPFTHQCASWVKGSSLWKGTRWRAGRCDTLLLISMFNRVQKWSEKSGIPVFLGEFGALDTADSISRALYTSFIAREALRRGWSYAYWKYNDNFGIYDDRTNTLRLYLLSALLKPDSTFAEFRHLAAGDTVPMPSPGSDTFIVLDDFEDSLPGRNSLIGKAGKEDSLCCIWRIRYSENSAVLDYKGDALKQGSGDAVRLVIKSGGEGGGNCLYIKEYLKGNNYPSISVTAPFPGEEKGMWCDLSSMTAVSFRAKGFGMLTLDIITDTILNGYPPSDNWGHFSCSFELTDKWKNYVVPVNELKPKPWSRPQQEMLDWSAGMKKACALSFTTHQNYGKMPDDSLEVFIDDIRLYGLTEEDMMPAEKNQSN